MRILRHLVPRRISLALFVFAIVWFGVYLLSSVVDAQPTCSSSASVTIAVENLSTDSMVTLNVEGELRDPARTCAGTGAASYATTVVCDGTGVARCGTISGLRPGAWINRVTVSVTGSAPQTQARHAVFLGAGAEDVTVSNVLTWTVYPATFVIASASEAALRVELDAAQAYTATHTGPVLVSFAAAAFPGASAPQTIDLVTALTCPADGRRAAICFTGSHLVVDALDTTAEPGAVILSVGDQSLSLLRVYGSDNVLRGLVLQGSTKADLATQADTVSFVGTAAQRNRLERSIVHGPTNGDAISAEGGAGQLGGASATNVVDHCELTGAEDRGLKVTTGAQTTIRESCVHDNRNGGVQSTLGGHVIARDNVIQHNVPGPSDNGFSAGTGGDTGERSTLDSAGDVVRFSGGRGLAVIDDADVVLSDDYLADNQFAGARIETLAVGAPAPTAAFGGVALACNQQSGISGSCSPAPAGGPVFCTTDADCCATASGCCVLDVGCADPVHCAAATPLGFGAVVDACAGCTAPAVTLGDVGAPGGNALTLNANVFPQAQGSNLDVAVPDLTLEARGNQWEHCGPGATCDTAAVAANDVALASGAGADIADAAAARAGTPSLHAVSLARPRAGDLVRVFGTGFNAIDGAACAQTTTPVTSCSTENPRVALQNRSQRNGNLLRLLIADQTLPIDIDAVTPTMLAFRMPVDCFAPASLEASKRDTNDVRVIGTIPFCDAHGCLDQDDGTPCDDGAFCTVVDACVNGDCRGTPRDCSAVADQCHDAHCNEFADRCDAVPKRDGTSCDDHDACTMGDACVSGVCTGGPPPTCDDGNACTDDFCDPLLGCQNVPNTAPCDDGSACTVGDVCSGGACQPGPPLVCDAFLNCDPQAGCVIGRPGCRKPILPHRAPLGIRNQPDDRRDGLTWQWTAGAATSKADFGSPLTTTDYTISIYDASGGQPVLRAHIPAGGLCGSRKPKPCWKETRSGFRYGNPALVPNGILRLDLHAGEAKKARVGIQGRGSLLGLPALPLTPPLKVQLERADGACWEADYDVSIGKNDARVLKARGD